MFNTLILKYMVIIRNIHGNLDLTDYTVANTLIRQYMVVMVT